MIPMVQITFRNIEPSADLEDWIREQVANLESLYSQIMRCHVTVEIQHGHLRKGSPYHIRIYLSVPGGQLEVKRQADLSARLRHVRETKMRKSLEVDAPHKDLRLAISDAFRVAGRRLEDYARRQRGAVKVHEPLPLGEVTKLNRDKGYGFLITPDGREVYFHRDSVLNRGFNRLQTGTKVSFAEEQGEKGPQASTVRLLGKRGISRVPRVA